MAVGDRQQPKQLAEVTDRAVRDGWSLQAGKEGAGEKWLNSTGKRRERWGPLCRDKSAREKEPSLLLQGGGLDAFPGQQGRIPDGWIKHPGTTMLVPTPGLTALASNNRFATARNGQVSSNHFL